MDWSLLLDAALEHVTVDFSSVCDYVFLIFRFPQCDEWVNSWPSHVYLIRFHQTGGAHLRNLIHLNELFGSLMDFPSSPASHLDWKQWLEPFRRGWGSQVAATWWAPLVPPMAMKNRISFFFRQEKMHCAGQRRPHMLSSFLSLPMVTMQLHMVLLSLM